MRARSDTLDLAWRDWSIHANKICKLCDLEVETLEHFLIDCSKLQTYRNNYICLQHPRNDNQSYLIKEVLILTSEYEYPPIYFVDLIYGMWIKRKELLEMDI